MYAFTSSLDFGRKLAAKFVSCAALTFAADFLFFNQRVGWTLGLFAMGLLLAVLLHQPHLKKSAAGKLLALAAGGLALAMVEEPSLLSASLYLLTIFGFVLLPKINTTDARHALGMVVGYFVLSGGMRLYHDSVLIAYVRKRLRKLHGSPYGWVLCWVLPVICSLGFVLLFAQANPIITRWMDAIEFRFLDISFWRVALWAAVLSGCWALVRPKLPQRVVRRSAMVKPQRQRFTLVGLLFNEQAIFTSLILFNILFLGQNMMDATFIWSGADLPKGMTYAQYAHRGAYPLMITALMAAFFILVAFKAEAAPSKSMCALVYAWVGQNIILVASSVARLLGYIAEYQLTYLRIAALIWMVLVAAGLLLIVARIALHHSNRWLVNRNAAVLYSTLYLCCFINFGGIIANYNINKALSDSKTPDTSYLEYSVGVAAIPALATVEGKMEGSTDYNTPCKIRERLQLQLWKGNWRAWSFRRHRIAQIPTKPCDNFIPAQPIDQESFLSPNFSLRK